MTGGLAKRYARALASVAKEESSLETVSGELANVSAWLADKELSEALNSPALSPENRQALVAQITESLKLSTLTRNFLALLTDKGRLHYFDAIQGAYRELLDRDLNQLRAVLRSAQPVSNAQQAEICSVLEAAHGKKILLSVEIDPELVAGVTIEIEGKIYDGSARTQLALVARAMSHRGAAG